MAVLARLDQSGLTLNASKCQFYKSELIFFGLKFSAKGISPTEDRCSALTNATVVSELRSLLGMVQYSSRFIAHLNTITDPLWKLCAKGVKWQWTQVEQCAFQDLKDGLKKGVHLAYFKKDWRTELHVDASPVGLCAVLVQFNPSNRKQRQVVSIASRGLTEVERRYSQCEKEGLAAVWGCERFWLNLFGSRFVLVTDNHAIQLIFGDTAKKPPARIERWKLRLTQFDYDIEHRPGKNNIADFFSRHPDSSNNLETLIQQQSTERYINLIVSSAKPMAIT